MSVTNFDYVFRTVKKVIFKLATGNDVPVQMDGQCCIQAMVNQMIYRRTGQKLRIVTGSLGLGIQNPFFEYGCDSSNITSRHVQKGDFHTWLEDTNGNVYDMVTGYMVLISQLRGKTYSFEHNDRIEGKTKTSLRAKGLHYIPGEDQANLNREVIQRVFSCINVGLVDSL